MECFFLFFSFLFLCVYRMEFFFPLWLNTSFVGDELKGCLNLAYFTGIWCKFEFFISICWIKTLRIGWIWSRRWWSCLWRGSCNKFFRECTERSLWVAGTPCFSCAFKIQGFNFLLFLVTLCEIHWGSRVVSHIMFLFSILAIWVETSAVD